MMRTHIHRQEHEPVYVYIAMLEAKQFINNTHLITGNRG